LPLKSLIFSLSVVFSVLTPVLGQQRIISVINQEGDPIAGADVLADFRPQASLQTGKTNAKGTFFILNSGAFKLTVIPPNDSNSIFEGTFTALDIQIVVTPPKKNMLINPVTITGATGPRAIADILI